MLGALASLWSGPSHADVPSKLSGLGDVAGLSPFWDWKTLETEHFRVTYPKELSETARKAASYLEDAQHALSPIFRWTPALKTQILVIDNEDAANGFTSPIERIGIVLFATPPDNWFSTYAYDDWLRLLVIHEYTHFLNMDTTRNELYQAGRYLFGDVLLPNALWPPWMLEGLAVYLETRLTQVGRGRSAYYEMILRSTVADGTLNTSKFITLDKINGRNPWFPGGETAYLFGYHLMNQVASGVPEGGKQTSDLADFVKDGDDLLGLMSERSGWRAPYFINGNLENLTAQTWYDFWDQWVRETQARAERELRKIRALPRTPTQPLTSGSYETLGSAASPDGQWLAYSRQGYEKKPGLYLLSLKGGETKRVDDKTFGVGLAFTPDSKKLFFSSLRRRTSYGEFSELAAYDLNSGEVDYFAPGLRARDPDLSPDGKWIAFTLTENQAVGVAIAELRAEDGKVRLGEVRRVFTPNRFDRASTPKFLKDGTGLVFSFHKNGDLGEDLLKLDLSSGRTETLVRDAHFNRFPAVDSQGRIHFVSDRTGIDNLYRLSSQGKPELVTNFETGIWLPSFGPQAAYGTVFGGRGSEIHRLELSDAPIDPDAVTIESPPAPKPSSIPSTSAAISGEKDYSIFPSIWPRQWAPLLFLYEKGAFAGAQVFGFDAVDRHRYLLAGAYDSRYKRFEWLTTYTNRSLGPNLTFLSAHEAGVTDDAEYGYSSGDLEFEASIDYTFQFTHSSITPFFDFKAVRQDYGPFFGTEWVKTLDARLGYTNAENSRLSVTEEEGRTALLAARTYLSPGRSAWKGFAADTEYIRLFEHTVLVPSIQGSMTSRRDGYFSPSSVIVSSTEYKVFDNLTYDPLDSLRLRGYGGNDFFARAAAIASLELRFPIWRIFRGWGTNPFFLDEISGFVFGESGVLNRLQSGAIYTSSTGQLITPVGEEFTFLPSAGAGLRLTTEILLRIPLIASAEYHHGFNRNWGGKDEVFFRLGLGALSF